MQNNFKFLQLRKTLVRKALLALVIASTTVAASAYSASKTLLVLGDSLSAEYGLMAGEGWVTLLQKKLASENRSVTIVNASISGETTSGGKARLPALLAKHQPSIVVIELGANDALRGLPLDATQENLRWMVASSQKISAKVLLVGMQIPPNYGGAYAKRFEAVFPIVAKKTKAALVPFMLQGIADKPAMFQADRIHPTAEAQSVIFENIWPHLHPLLKP